MTTTGRMKGLDMAFLRTPALLLARVALGFIFVMHGWQKFTTGHSALTADFRKLDVPRQRLPRSSRPGWNSSAGSP